MPPRRTRARASRKAKEPSPDVYDDMLAEAAVIDPVENSNRPLKRRRVTREVSIPKYRDDGTLKYGEPSTLKVSRPDHPQSTNTRKDLGVGRPEQTVEASSESDDSDDFAFEDVDLRQQETPK